MLFLFHAALHPDIYPWFRRVRVLLLPTVARSVELQWSLEFLDLILSAAAHHGASMPTVMFREDLEALGASGGEFICYDRLGMLGMTTSEFGLFADPYEAEIFRSFVYSHFNLTGGGDDSGVRATAAQRRGPNDHSTVFLAERKRTRRLGAHTTVNPFATCHPHPRSSSLHLIPQ